MVDGKSDSRAEPRRRAGSPRALALLLVVLAVAVLGNVLPAGGSGEPRSVDAAAGRSVGPEVEAAASAPVPDPTAAIPEASQVGEVEHDSAARTPDETGVRSTAVAASGPSEVTAAPVPDGLWDVAAPLPPDRTWVIFDGQPGDAVIGRFAEFDLSNSDIAVADEGGPVRTTVAGDGSWAVVIAPPSGSTSLPPGYYPDVAGYPFQGPAHPGLSVEGGSGCNEVNGWIAVDGQDGSGADLHSLTFRFEFRCDRSLPVRGKVHYVAADRTLPPGPVLPVPTDLWDTAPSVPIWQDYLILEGLRVDTRYQTGVTKLIIPAPSHPILVSQSPDGTYLRIDDGGYPSAFTNGVVQSIVRRGPLSVGYYPEARGEISMNPAKGGASPPNGCMDGTGWFAVDRVERSYGTVTALTARFMQWCGDRQIHAKLRYTGAASPPVGAPSGSLEAVGRDGGVITVSGWARDTGGRPVVVRIEIDGVPTFVEARDPRPDLAAALGTSAGRSGFSARLVAPPGAHLVCAYALDDAVPAANTLLDCRPLRAG